MKITSVGYNYSNQKAQKNNNRTQFGMAVPNKQTEEFLMTSLAKNGEGRSSALLGYLQSIFNHSLNVLLDGDAIKIMSPNGRASRRLKMAPGKEEEILWGTSSALNRYSELKLSITPEKRIEINTRLKNAKAAFDAAQQPLLAQLKEPSRLISDADGEGFKALRNAYSELYRAKTASAKFAKEEAELKQFFAPETTVTPSKSGKAKKSKKTK